ncbi:hypothetical protein QYS60_08715 [Rhodococcus sp. GXMU-t2271]|uniref:Permease n=1 Tax=Rhodococcus ruber BKS 20-38 TaxID=1278076 RepID=M2ZX80_9NOCA|nr:hypothetical protein [Rhodococcus ruber]EME64959.1 hypothetical protein G352_12017 [Rhodococcus ruber BKS 20-38]
MAGNETAQRSGLPPWAKKALWSVAAVLALVVAYFALAAFVPRWWAQRVAGLADAGFARGTAWGLLFGMVCTFVPLALFAAVWRIRTWRRHRVLQVVFVVAAVVVAIPNLMTLSIVLGNGNAAHAGERILDVDAPGFRGATLVGAVVGVVLFLVFAALSFMYRKRGRDLERERARDESELRSDRPGRVAGAPD